MQFFPLARLMQGVELYCTQEGKPTHWVGDRIRAMRGLTFVYNLSQNVDIVSLQLRSQGALLLLLSELVCQKPLCHFSTPVWISKTPG